MKALLVIDMQKVSFTIETPRYDAEKVVANINKLVRFFRKASHLVINIQHDGTGSGICEKGTEEWEVLNTLEFVDTDINIDKTANDVFYNSELLEVLKRQGVHEVIVTGSATDFCVAASVQSAISKDFNVTVIADAHTTADRPHAKANEIIEHYNYVWNNMLPTKGKVRSIRCNEFLESCV